MNGEHINLPRRTHKHIKENRQYKLKIKKELWLSRWGGGSTVVPLLSMLKALQERKRRPPAAGHDA